MFIRIEPSSGVPITRQIADQIRAQCAAGTLTPGTQLPSVRVLARELAVNQNTILHIYERLTMEGLLDMRHGDGTYVAQRPPTGQFRLQQQALAREVDLLVQRALSLGLSEADVHALVDRAFGRAAQPARKAKGS
jgi:GntR family transcriptional regulator